MLIQEFRTMAAVLIALKMGRASQLLRLPGTENQVMERFPELSLSSYENGDWILESGMGEAHRELFRCEDNLIPLTR